MSHPVAEFSQIDDAERGLAEHDAPLPPSSAPGCRPLIKDVYKSWGAEMVFITSNFQGNREMMEGCKAAGIPAFGTLWKF